MTPGHRDKLIDLVGEAMGRPAAERAAFVRAACDDPGAVREALSLLEAAHGAGGFLERPTIAGGDARAGAAGEAPGAMIGRYRLLELIGEGGFGRVFMAEQREPVVRRVAVKVIKAGMDTAQVVARFEAERQALALMDHPGIATVFDGGATESGRPYFVMELVRGMPLTEYCDRATMPVRERLELFRDVCGAVQHAHQKGVIHRDLKPGNVLVAESDGRAHPKIIDFGIAKATHGGGRLTDRTLFTEFRQLIGTPEYMSPEQALGAAGGAYGGADVDTRSDVYSLGVILYELLTGTTPLGRESLRSGDLAEVQRLIREAEPPRPSTRLATLATRADVAAHRRIEPGRLGALLRGDLDWIVLKAVEKDRNRRYDTAAALAEDVRRYLEHEPVSATPPSTVYRLRKFVRRNRGVVGAGAGVAAALVTGLGLAVWQASVAARERDAARAAEADTRRVAEFQAAQLRGIDPQAMGARLREDLILTAQQRGSEQALMQEGELDTLLSRVNFTDLALRMLDRTIFARAMKAADEGFTNQPLVRAALLSTIGETMLELGLLDGAHSALTQAAAIRRAELGEDHEATIRTVNLIGCVLLAQGRVADAEVLLRDSLDRARRALGVDHPAAIDALNNFGMLLRAQNKIRDAHRCFAEALERNRRVHGSTDVQTLKAMANTAAVLMSLGRHSEAEPYAREALGGFRMRLGEDHADTIKAIGNLGYILRSQGKASEAEPLLRECLETRRRMVGDDHPDTLRALSNLGELLLHQIEAGEGSEASAAEAESVLRQVLERRRRRFGDQHRETVASAHNLGNLLIQLSQYSEAETLLRGALSSYDRLLGPGNAFSIMARLDLGRALAGSARYAEAEPLLLEAARVMGGHAGGAGSWALDLANLYEAWDKAEPGKGYAAKAAEWRTKAVGSGGR